MIYTRNTEASCKKGSKLCSLLCILYLQCPDGRHRGGWSFCGSVACPHVYYLEYNSNGDNHSVSLAPAILV